MQIRLFLSFALVSGTALWAADSYTPLDVKTGQWETTMTMQSSGTPPIPPEVLDRLTPDQRAKMEASLKARGSQAPRTSTSKSCLKKEDLEKPLLFNKDQQTCKTTIISSSRSKVEVKIDCAQPPIQGNGSITVEALSAESVKITTHMATGDGTRRMNMNMSGTSKWLGPVCTEAK